MNGTTNWAVAAVSGVTMLGVWLALREPAARRLDTPPLAIDPQPVGCLGRIEPEDGVLKLAAPSYSGRSLVRQILVGEGNEVAAGQIIAVLDSRDRLAAAWEEAQSRVALARTQLALVQQGAKQPDLEALRAEVARRQAEFENARAEYWRSLQLHQAGLISASEMEMRQTALKSREQILRHAQERLSSLAEVRPLDVEFAQTQLETAVAQARRAEAELDQAYIRSPRRGRLLKIHVRAGEAVGDQGVAELGAIERMYVVAEVYESDVTRVRLGLDAWITGEALAAPLKGKVIEIGQKVGKSRMLETDPTAFSDTRVVEVKILLDDGATVAGLSGARVRVRIGERTAAEPIP